MAILQVNLPPAGQECIRDDVLDVIQQAIYTQLRSIRIQVEDLDMVVGLGGSTYGSGVVPNHAPATRPPEAEHQ